MVFTEQLSVFRIILKLQILESPGKYFGEFTPSKPFFVPVPLKDQ
jgi:hypothetical protein